MKTLVIRVASLSLFAISAWAVEWKPITNAELQLKQPTVQKDADAEGIFWEVRLQDQMAGGDLQVVRTNYIRMKVFTEKGRERAKVELPYGRKTSLSDIAGRTVKPDGRIVEMKKDGVFDTQVVKGKGLKLRAKSFTLADVQPGDLIEYQWKEVEMDALSNYIRLPLQRDIPVQTVRYHVKPFSSEYINVAMRALILHGPQKGFVPGPQGFSTLEVNNMPAFREEPYMPSPWDVQVWALVFYVQGDMKTPEKFWPDYGRKIYSATKDEIKVSAEAKAAVAAALDGASGDEAKAKAIYAWIHKNIRNVNTALVKAEDRRGFKPNKNSNETLKQKLGTGHDINMLFAAMTQAAGLESRVAMTGDRDDLTFNKSIADPYFLHQQMIAVKIEGAWKYYDPASPYLPAGLPSWDEQEIETLISDGKTPEWGMSPAPVASQSKEAHSGKVNVNLDGSIEGDFTMVWTGHRAVEERVDLMPITPEERDQHLIDDLKDRFGSPEITNVKWEGVDDADARLVARYHMKVPNYVQRTGRRFFLQPAIFHRNNAARFPSSTREHLISFRFPWSESDSFTFELPEGYELEQPQVPGPIESRQTLGWKVGGKISGSTLTFERNFFLGEDRVTIFPASAYPLLKRAFDDIQAGDQFSVALRQEGGR